MSNFRYREGKWAELFDQGNRHFNWKTNNKRGEFLLGVYAKRCGKTDCLGARLRNIKAEFCRRVNIEPRLSRILKRDQVTEPTLVEEESPDGGGIGAVVEIFGNEL